jgi:type II secretory pathway component GspD/PulD (secretin)
MNVTRILAIGIGLVGVVAVAPTTAYAQQERNPNSITLDLKDAPIRTTLEMAFKQAGITNYVIDNNVAGFVTMTITDQPFENALKLIMRAATVPLTYIKENNVYIVKPRQISLNTSPATPDISQETTAANNVSFERIPLTFIDPIDLMGAFGNILIIQQFMRGGGGGMGGGMMGGGMGGMGGGMGGMGGGMGGMGGGMGGFGGGRNF